MEGKNFYLTSQKLNIKFLLEYIILLRYNGMVLKLVNTEVQTIFVFMKITEKYDLNWSKEDLKLKAVQYVIFEAQIQSFEQIYGRYVFKYSKKVLITDENYTG